VRNTAAPLYAKSVVGSGCLTDMSITATAITATEKNMNKYMHKESSLSAPKSAGSGLLSMG